MALGGSLTSSYTTKTYVVRWEKSQFNYIYYIYNCQPQEDNVYDNDDDDEQNDDDDDDDNSILNFRLLAKCL